MMNNLFRRSLLVICLTAALTPMLAQAKPALTGFDSASTIPDSLFDETEQVKPWIKPQTLQKKPLRPATANNLQQQQQFTALEQSLKEQQRVNNELLAGHQAEKQQWEAQLQAFATDNNAMEQQIQQVAQLQQSLSESQTQHGDAQQQLNLLRTELAAHQLLADTHAIQQSALKDKLQDKEQSVVGLIKQIETLQKEAELLQRAPQPDAAQLAELKQHQEKITALETSLHDAEQQHASTKAQLEALQLSQARAKPENHLQKLAYANGVAFADNIVESLRAQQNLGMEPDRPMVLAGIQDAFDKRIALNSEEVKTLVTELDDALNEKLQAQQQEQAKEQAQQYKFSEALIAKTKLRKGVIQLDGAYYIVTNSGQGKKLTPESTVNMLITGRLADGSVFDNSGQNNKMQKIKLNTLIPALTNVLSNLRADSEVEIILPPELAFGKVGIPGLIPGGAALVFDVKLKN